MKNNHPVVKAYFDAQPKGEFSHMNNDESSNLQNIHTPCEYRPRVVDMHNPRWIENANKISFLEEMFKRDFYNSKNSYNTNNEGTIEASCHSQSNGVLRAAPFVIDTENGDRMDYAFANIINTENAGLRYVHFTESGNKLDMGPVDHPCFIGNEQRAEGLYIPLSNTKAIADGILILDELFDRTVTKNPSSIDIDELPFEYE